MQLTLEVNGMNSDNCEKKVKGGLEELEGVHGVEVNLDSRKVDVVYDESYVTKSLMKETIEAQGYDPIG